MIEVIVRVERWPLIYPFRISGYEFTEHESLVVELRDGNLRGWGESAGVYYKHDSPEQGREQVQQLADRIAGGMDRVELLEALPAGGARNAIDCALWDLEAKRRGVPVWQLAGLTQAPSPVLTTYTLGADAPEAMAARARDFRSARALKLKLTGGEDDARRVRAVREARPDVWLGVDGNQGFTRSALEKLIPVLVDAGVQLIEQPLPLNRDADMDGLRSPIAVAADESAQDADDVGALAGRFDVVNIKLDKCGGLTAALMMQEQARKSGLTVMAGCMGGTSLAMAPAFVLAQYCEITDLDGPILLAKDRSPGAIYENGCVSCPPELWGGIAQAPLVA